MSYPTGRDYGDEDSRALVPGTLTTYRHFMLDLDRGVIAPMSWQPGRAGGMGSYGYGNPAQQPYRPMDEVHVAMCARRSGYRSALIRVQQEEMEAQTGRLHEKSPTEWCTCGFYAHYDSETDFYPSFRWGKAYARISGREDLVNVVAVRAVVEMSGTCVMGRLGVRAEKMKIVALTVDWTKQMQDQQVQQVRRSAEMSVNYMYRSPWSLSTVDLEEPYDYFIDGGAEEYDADEERARIENRVASTAMAYKARYYDDVAEMYEAHPKADISALGVDTTPRPKESWDAFMTGAPGFANLQTQMYSMGQVVGRTNQAMRLWVDSLFKEESKPKPKPSVPQSIQDIIDAKANRPAPPGSGIDRRRGRIR